MNDLLQEVLQFSLLPAICLLMGGLIAGVRPPSVKLSSTIQHFAAGVVFSAVAVELIPSISHTNSPIIISIGFLLGLGLMLFVKAYTNKGIQDEAARTGLKYIHSRYPTTLVTAVAIDLFIDGNLIGIAFKTGIKDGLLIAIALGIEIFFLGLSTATTIMTRDVRPLLNSLTMLALAPMVVLGALFSTLLLQILPGVGTTAVLAFGIAALLYLVTEELLVEAHEVKETPMITTAFFLGFLCIFLIDTQFR